jgi:O-antigen/teichoic acid export membrane protein
LRENIIWSFVGTTIFAFCQWAILVFLTKTQTAEMVGEFNFGFAVTAPIIMLTNLQLRAIIATDAKHDFQFQDYASVRLISVLLGIVAICFTGFIYDESLPQMYAIFAIGIAKSIEAGSDLYYGFLQQHERMDYIAYSQIIRGVVGSVGFVAGIYLTGSLLFGILCMSMVWLVVLGVYDFRISKPLIINNNYKITQNFAIYLLIVKIALPLGLGVFVLSLVSNLPKLLLEHFYGIQEIGYFSSIMYIVTGLTLVVSSLNQAVRPRLAQILAVNKEKFFALLLKLIAIISIFGALGLIVVILFGDRLLSILYNPEYANYHLAFVWLMLFFVLSTLRSLVHTALQAARVFNIQFYLAILGLFITVSFGYLLIPNLGAIGAAVSLVIFSLVDLIIASLALWYYLVFRSGNELRVSK